MWLSDGGKGSMNGFKRQKKPDRALSDQSLVELMIRLPCCPFVEQA
jgi:hypothetical protein